MARWQILQSWLLLISTLPVAWTGHKDVMAMDSSKRLKQCFCDMKSSDYTFPLEKFHDTVSAAKHCNGIMAKKQFQEADELQRSLEYRISQLKDQVDQFESEYDAGFYSIIFLRIIEIELAELNDMLRHLQNLDKSNKHLAVTLTSKVVNLTDEVQELESYDRLEVYKEYEKNKRLKRSLDECEVTLQATAAPTVPPVFGNCPHGQIFFIEGPKTYMLSQFGASYPYGAWGKDPVPAPGKETMHWVMVLVNSNLFGSYFRSYPSYGNLRTGKAYTDVSIASSVTTTNSIMGPCAVLYDDAFYYNCYNVPQVCKYTLSTKQFQTLTLPGAGIKDKFPFCTLSSTISYTDIDLATDENGLWVIYATESNYGNIVLSRLNTTRLDFLETWNTTIYKKSVSNTFMACGVLYATRHINSEYEEIFYMFDTKSGQESRDLNIRFRKLSNIIQQINYNPQDQLLYVFNDAYLVTYKTWFEK
ncbi:olfactomedin-4-like [Protopterus annectens]|uniref:olfactomedin-4-like n=1 Tax=Protopterus annectens TaxID=7888 RepID=UPI001CFB5215|nr:olfactomedin-4-like [Protopterus annectens]